MIIGVTGTNGAGKTTIINILKERGFRELSLSDYLRDIAEKEHGKEARNDRDYLRKLANSLRQKHGPGYLMHETLAKVTDLAQNYVIDSIRTPGEVEAMRAFADALLIGVDARLDVRYQRLLARSQSSGRKESFKTYEEFLADEQVENSADAHGQQLRATLDLADIVFYNNGTQEELKAKVYRTFQAVLN